MTLMGDIQRRLYSSTSGCRVVSLGAFEWLQVFSSLACLTMRLSSLAHLNKRARLLFGFSAP
jgi:hypothetical protein